MLPIILTKPLHALVIGAGKAAAYKFQTLHDAHMPISALSLNFAHIPSHLSIQTHHGDFYTIEESFFDSYDLIYLTIPYPTNSSQKRIYTHRIESFLSRNKLVDVASKPNLGNFIHPATRRVNHLIVSVSTSGQNPKQAVKLANDFKKQLESHSTP
jgi:siroheme synthase (precorrin-2 oxidase/ferrochelatase)